ncbi:MAG TPA: DUF1501 domain-containing protein, partial [Sandaracinaceae bacterium]
PGHDRFYVFAYFSGGWDVLLGIDPRDPARFNDDNVGVTRIQPSYEGQAQAQFQEPPAFAPGTEILLGPAARPLDAVASRLAVVRGMSMDTLTHEVGRRRFLTGKPPSGLQARGSSGSAWLAAQLGGDALIPNLSVRVESFNPDLPSEVSALRVGSAADLVAMLRRADPALDPGIDSAIDEMHAREAACPRALGSPLLRASESARRRMHAVLSANVQALFDFGVDPASIADAELRAKMELLHAHFDLSGSGSSAQAQAAIAGQAITNGVARVVTIEAASGLDTHFDDWEDEQAPRQYAGFDAIARLARYLEAVPYGTSGESMLDRTVIVGFSEFMRTPLRNARGGRDHWLTNSCFLLGGRVRGGAVIGASSDVGMAPQIVDLETGRVVESEAEGQVIRPEHVLRTLLVDAGMEEDRADLRVPPIPALMNG